MLLNYKINFINNLIIYEISCFLVYKCIIYEINHLYTVIYK